MRGPSAQIAAIVDTRRQDEFIHASGIAGKQRVGSAGRCTLGVLGDVGEVCALAGRPRWCSVLSATNLNTIKTIIASNKSGKMSDSDTGQGGNGAESDSIDGNDGMAYGSV